MALRKVVEKWLMNAVTLMYKGVELAVRTTEGDSRAFDVKVRLLQGCVLSPSLLATVMEVITKELKEGLP